MIRAASEWDGQSLERLRRRWARSDIYVYGLVDSTNTRAKELAKAGAAPGTIVLADAQAAGRGLARRRWHSPSGSGLYVSLILRPACVPNPLLVPLLAGLAVARAIEQSAGGIRVGLKWPNDLIAGDRKMGGVLVEGAWTRGKPAWLVIGVGINVHVQPDDFPEALRPVATSLDTAGRRISRLALADSVIGELEARCNELPVRLEGDLLKQLAERDWLRDRRCIVESPGREETRGVAVGVTPDGALVVRSESGVPISVTSGRIRADELLTPEY
jgi:BirA family biotin operon repressor/biotin-[acetyl-CoA-carboxylase] ligase